MSNMHSIKKISDCYFYLCAFVYVICPSVLAIQVHPQRPLVKTLCDQCQSAFNEFLLGRNPLHDFASQFSTKEKA